MSATLQYFIYATLKLNKVQYRLFGRDLLLLRGAGEGKSVLIVRYLPRDSFRKVQVLLQRGYRLIYFMDDDLMDEQALAGLPKAYAKRIYQEATRHRAFLEKNCSEFWVSTPYLAQKYPHWQARVLQPHPAEEIQQQHEAFWVCYHGSASHQDELTWLQPLVAQLQDKSKNTRFELFGDHAIYKSFRTSPRVQILHPMSWDNYLDYTQSVRRDVGLAPLLPNAFNAARSISKFLDMTRMGAVGLYSNVVPYCDFIRDGVDGFLLENNYKDWLDAIEYLQNNPEVRERMALAAQERVRLLGSEPVFEDKDGSLVQ